MAIDRRNFLSSIGYAGLLCPLYSLLVQQARGAEPPKRIVILIHPMGVNQEFYWPTGSGKDLLFNSTYYSGFQFFKDKISMFQGLQTYGESNVGDGDHATGVLTALTGAAPVSGDKAGGPSVDQHIASFLPEGKRTVLNLGGCSISGDIGHSRPMWDLSGQPIPPRNDPLEVASSLFAGIPVVPSKSNPLAAATPDSSARIRAELDRQVLDSTLSDIDRLIKRVPSADRSKLESAQAAIITMKNSIILPATSVDGSSLNPQSSSMSQCIIPSVSSLDFRNMAQVAAVTSAHIDIIGAAFACDLARIATINWGSSGGGDVQGFAHDINEADPLKTIQKDLHTLSHMAQQENADANNDARQYACTNKFYGDQVLKLVKKLSSIPEGDKTMLDYTCILWTSEFAQGTHNGMAAGGGRLNKTNHPVMFLGTLGSAPMAGLQLENGPQGRALQTLCSFMGVPQMGMGGRGGGSKPLI